MSEQFSDSEKALIERLRRAPQPELSSEVRDVIQARMLEAVNIPPAPVPRPFYGRPMFVIAVLAVVGALIASGILFALSRQNQGVLPTPTVEFTLTLVPTETLVSTSTPRPTNSPSPSSTPVPTDTATWTATPSPTVTETSTATATIPTATSTATGKPTTVSNTSLPSSDSVWQDDGTCNNPPPDWAPANGWRRRCQGQTGNTTGGGNNNGNGNSGSNGNGNSGGNGNGNGNGKPNKP